ncbi:threonine synthase [Limisalsivibrio acetivorans]|uniref:threonine synthase n=1 Tax=Limisalsivibrio acetivorans TaxID=1304888 RepID=UPI0003B48C98|nr:threonine synthase [Limisalsivibrio acetivorans]
MKYVSTRGRVEPISFKDAVMMGLAEDGGLLVPAEVPKLTGADMERLRNLSYPELAYEIVSLFTDDIEPEKLRDIINRSYKVFDTEEVIPVVKKNGIYIAEIFHGPTYAFKDIALQFLGNLFEHILQERDQQLNIIGATSGDTGSAAIAGVRGRKNINIFILHPEGRVSPVQEMQMTSVPDENVFNLAVEGTFDDCQYIVKSIFADLDFKRQHSLGAVNSINWARVLAQIVYYFHAYFRAAENGEKIRFVVPTGNFGNIFAGYFAKLMGLPIEKLILATNENNILSRFIMAGDYTLQDVVATHSPSMDIQLASNLERYLYFLYEKDTERINRLMETLKQEKGIKFPEADVKKVQEEIDTYSVTNDETVGVIRDFYNETGYVLDPHTACGVKAGLVHKEEFKTVCLSTAHPAKFPDVVRDAIGEDPDKPEGIKRIEGLEKRKVSIDNDIEKVKAYIADNV